MKLQAFKAALPHTIPICIGFLLLGMSYGFLMQSKGFSFVYPMLMSLLIFAGTMEFVTIHLLLSAFNPLYVFLLTVAINARHVFYGISMLEKYKNCGWKKLYLIFGTCDESFSINCTVSPPPDIDRSWFMFFVTLLNHIYWVLGATLGGLLGYVIHFDTKGLDFILTALFVVLFLNQWDTAENRQSAAIGILCALACLVLFGSQSFMLPSMACIVLCFSLRRKTCKTVSEDVQP